MANRSIKSTVTAIIQARMESKRLPGKSMLELGGRPLLAHVIERSMQIEGVQTVVLATPSTEEDARLGALAESMGCSWFAGSMDNVLDRYYQAWRRFGGDYVVRVTGDNPFTDPEYASMAVEIALESGSDLCSIQGIPLGTAVEVIRAEALEKCFELSVKPYHFEHVTPFIKEHTELFRIERYPVSFDQDFEQVRLTVDTAEDYALAKVLYDRLYAGKPFSLADIVALLRREPGLAGLNARIKQRPMEHSES